ncbi:MAG: VOC family protein [Candidatus Binatus sp.]
MVRGRVHVRHGSRGAGRRRFSQWRTGLHHLSFRARSREEVDSCCLMLKEIGAKIIFPAEPGPFWPGYYSVVFEDPDGTRLEMNYIPEEGWQAVAAAADAIAKRKSPL